MKRAYEYIIVGQGLAGSCLALRLFEEGKKFLVINNPNANSASKVAGGLINPITGRKMVLTWRANEIFPFQENFYRNAEQLLDETFYHQVPIYRPFISIEEQNEWQGKSVDENYAPFIKSIIIQSESEKVVNDPFGGLLLNKSGYLDTEVFLKAVSNWLIKNECVQNEQFNLADVNFIENGVVYKDIIAEKIVFCDGVSGVDNPYFTEIKYRPVKGEVLKIEISPELNKVYNRGVFLMPRNGSHTVGSNYNHKELSWEPTEKGKQEIETKLKALLSKPYKIVAHKAGVRPSVSDRRPVIGASSKMEQMVIFNGLGTKGVSLAPFFANQLVNWMCKGQEIDKEVNVKRFF